MSTHIESRIKPKDIEYINYYRAPWHEPKIEYNELLDKTQSWLSEMGCKQTVVDLIRKNSHPKFGRYRTPILVQSNEDSRFGRDFVIKSYDNWRGKETEIDVLKIVQDKVAPKVYFYGNEFYAEEYIPTDKSTTLEEIASEDINHALQLAGKTQAEIAKLKVDYNHSKMLDEIHIYNDKIVVTDFGTSRQFVKKSDDVKFKSWISCIERKGIRYFLYNYNNDRYTHGVNSSLGLLPNFEVLEIELGNLSKDPTELFNLGNIYLMSGVALQTYFKENEYMGDDDMAWNRTLDKFNIFIDAFNKAYLEHDS